MSTPTVPTKPDTPPAARAEKREAPEVLPPLADDRAVDADLLLDIPQLSVEELSLELDASLLLDHVKVEAKGLEASLYLRADFGHLAALSGRGEREGRGGLRTRAAEVTRVRSGLRELLGAPAAAEQPRPAAEESERRDEPEDDERRNGHDAGGQDVAERARHAVAQGAKAAGLTAAGLAGGALLESRVKPSRKLHIPRRRTRARFLRDELVKRLP